MNKLRTKTTMAAQELWETCSKLKPLCTTTLRRKQSKYSYAPPWKDNIGITRWISRTLLRAKQKDSPQSIMSHWDNNNTLPHQSR